MKNLRTITSIDDYEDAVNECVDFFEENMEDSIFYVDFLEQKEMAVRDDDYTELHSTIIDFIDDNFEFEDNTLGLDKADLKVFYSDTGFSIDISTTVAYKIADELDL
tara:strand:+ start:248 stop:568 length:321 start_codon:yes stop_codon:yes gene_type:complete